MDSVRWYVKILILVLAIPLWCSAQVTSSQPFSGIVYRREVRSDPPMHLHIVQVDLSAPGIEIYVSRGGVPHTPLEPGKWTTVLETVRGMAQRDRLDVAVNGNFFGARDQHELFGQTIKYPLGSPAFLCGAAMTDGKAWSPPDLNHASMVVDNQGKIRMGYFARIPTNAKQVVSGNYLLLDQGTPVDDRRTASPHTAVGTDREQKTLTLLVVDGRRPDYSAGLTSHDVAVEMRRLGCWDALNLDGGGSSTLVMRNPQGDRWQVMNRPSDGYQLPIPLSVERPVACALGIRVRER